MNFGKSAKMAALEKIFARNMLRAQNSPEFTNTYPQPPNTKNLNTSSHLVPLTTSASYLKYIKENSLAVVLFSEDDNFKDAFEQLAQDLKIGQFPVMPFGWIKVNTDAGRALLEEETNILVFPTTRFFLNENPVHDIVGDDIEQVEHVYRALWTSKMINIKSSPNTNEQRVSGTTSEVLASIILNPDKLTYNAKDETAFLGKGGFGTVVKGKYLRFPVAVKVLNATPKASLHETAVKQQQFLTEIVTMASLHHPCLLEMLGVTIKDDQWHLVMEFLPHTLLKYICSVEARRDPFSLRDRLRILIDCANGLSFLHSKNIGHFDIKPENVLLSDGTELGFKAKLADFGLSHAISRSLGTTLCGGTPGYMAPEMYKLKSTDKVGIEADIYSFGMMAFEVLTFHPANDETDVSLSYRPPFPKNTNEDFIVFIESCWKADPSKRLTIEQVQICLENLEKLYGVEDRSNLL